MNFTERLLIIFRKSLYFIFILSKNLLYVEVRFEFLDEVEHKERLSEKLLKRKLNQIHEGGLILR